MNEARSPFFLHCPYLEAPVYLSQRRSKSSLCQSSAGHNAPFDPNHTEDRLGFMLAVYAVLCHAVPRNQRPVKPKPVPKVAGSHLSFPMRSERLFSSVGMTSSSSFPFNAGSSSIASLRTLTILAISSSLMTRGGARRMMFCCVGFACFSSVFLLVSKDLKDLPKDPCSSTADTDPTLYVRRS